MLNVKRVLLLICSALSFSGISHADPEIMVHENELAQPGQWVGTLHVNHTPHGDRNRSDSTWPTHRLTSVMAEFATGIAPGWEAGIHLPFMRAGVSSNTSQAGDWGPSAVMFRLKHITETESGLFWGFNAEYDINAYRYVEEPNSIEFRTIVGIDRPDYRLTANPHWMYGFGKSYLDPTPHFNVDWKALHKLNGEIAWGFELYTDWGQTTHLKPGDGDRTLYLVGEFDTRIGAIHVGIGRGYKETPERQVLKLVWSKDF